MRGTEKRRTRASDEVAPFGTFSTPQLATTHGRAKASPFELDFQGAHTNTADDDGAPRAPSPDDTRHDELDETEGDGDAAIIHDEDAGAYRIYCAHPGCQKHYASSDGVRKHAKRYHPEWLRNLDQEKRRCGTPTPPGERHAKSKQHATFAPSRSKRRRDSETTGPAATQAARNIRAGGGSVTAGAAGDESDVVGAFASMLSLPFPLSVHTGSFGSPPLSPNQPSPLNPSTSPFAPAASIGAGFPPFFQPQLAHLPAEVQAHLLAFFEQQQQQQQQLGACGLPFAASAVPCSSALPWPPTTDALVAANPFGWPSANAAAALALSVASSAPPGMPQAAALQALTSFFALHGAGASGAGTNGEGNPACLSTPHGHEEQLAPLGSTLCAYAPATTGTHTEAFGSGEGADTDETSNASGEHGIGGSSGGGGGGSAFRTPEGTPYCGSGGYDQAVELSALACPPACAIPASAAAILGGSAGGPAAAGIIAPFADGELEQLFDDALEEGEGQTKWAARAEEADENETETEAEEEDVEDEGSEAAAAEAEADLANEGKLQAEAEAEAEAEMVMGMVMEAKAEALEQPCALAVAV